MQQMAKDGHLIGVHCMAHVDLARQPIEKSVEEIRETADWIEAVTGKRPEYIRPPYGSWSTELQERVSMTPVFWDVDTLDWKNPEYGADCEAYLQKVRRFTRWC